MRKLVLYPATLAFLMLALNSCSKCGHCEKNGSIVIVEVCSQNKTQYDGAMRSCDSMNGSWETD